MDKEKVMSELDDLTKQLARHNEQKDLAVALGHKFGKILQTRWPSSTSLWSQAFAAGLIAVEDDTGYSRGCRSLLIQWMMEHFAGFVVEQFLPDVIDVHQHLMSFQYTASDPLVFNDLDNRAWYENESVFIMESQFRKKMVIVDGMKIHARRIWYKYDESRNGTFSKLKTLSWYRKNNWKLEYGDCRDAGYILSKGTTLSPETVDHADSHWCELEMFIFDILGTQTALHDVQTARMSKLHREKNKK